MDMIVRFILGNIPLIGIILAFACAARARPFARGLALYLLLFAVGLGGLWGAAYQTLAPQMVADSIGWSTSPFEFEVAAANLGMGLGGIIAFLRKSREFCLAIVIVDTCFSWGAAGNHIYDLVVFGNHAVNNAGIILWTDLLIPLLLILSLFFWKKNQWT